MLRIANIIVALFAVLTAPVLASSTTTELSANSRLEFFVANAGHQPGHALVSSETLLSSSVSLRLTTAECSVAGGNTYNIATVTSSTAINTSGSNNTFNISSNAPTNTGNLAGITSPLSINVGSGGSNQLVISDAGDSAPGTAIITSGSIAGFAPAAINYSATSGNFTHGSTNDGILLIGSSTAAKTFVVQSTRAGSTTKISGGPTVTIDVGSTLLANNGRLDQLTGLLTLTGGIGSNLLYFNDHGASTAGNYTVTPTLVKKVLPTSFAGVAYDATFSSLSFDATDLADQFTVTPSFSTSFSFNGMLPNASSSGPQNSISLVTAGLFGIALNTTTFGRGAWTFTSGQKPVQFQNFGSFSPGDPINAVGAAMGGRVDVFDTITHELKFTLTPFPGYTGGVQVATGDINGDGFNDLIVAPSGGLAPTVKIFDGATGAPLNAFNVFSAGFHGGVNLAYADINGDGKKDLVVGAGPGMLPQVRVLDGKTLLSATPAQIGPVINAFASTFTGGVNVAAADLTNSGRAQVIVGEGAGGSPTVNIYNFSGTSYTLLKSFNAFTASFRGGVYVAAADLTGSGTGRQLIVSAGAGFLPMVNVYSSANLFKSAPLQQTTSFLAFANTYTGGVRIAAQDGLGIFMIPASTNSTKSVRLASFTSPSLQPTVVDALFSTDINLGLGGYVG
jgi:hypothetical protein